MRQLLLLLLSSLLHPCNHHNLGHLVISATANSGKVESNRTELNRKTLRLSDWLVFNSTTEREALHYFRRKTKMKEL